MMPRPRAAVLALPTYGTGRPATPARHRLASNESPFPPSPAVQAAVARSAAQANRYPPLATVELEHKLAARYGVPAECVLAGGGSVVLLEQLIRAYAGPGDAVAFGWLSYEAYPIVIGAAGAAPQPVSLRDAYYDLDALHAAITPQTRVVLVCNPNNPTGTVLPPGTLTDFLDQVPDDLLVIVDEAYREFVPDGATDDAFALSGEHRNVAVLRTFSKAYGLAGLRAGYCIADPAVLAAARRVALPFTLSAPALAAALAVLDEPDTTAAQVRDLTAARDELAADLRARGVPVSPSGANFLWLPLAEGSGAFAERCAAAGIGVRLFPGKGVRVTVGDAAAHDALLATLPTGFSYSDNNGLQIPRTTLGLAGRRNR